MVWSNVERVNREREKMRERDKQIEKYREIKRNG